MLMRTSRRSAVALLVSALLAACAPAVSRPAPRSAVPAARFGIAAGLVVAPDSGIRLLGARPASPRYPAQARQTGTEAYPVVAYVVDTLGRIEPGTLTFLAPQPPLAFRQSLCAWAPLARFAPLRYNGQLRRALLVQAFAFEIGQHGKYLPDEAPYRAELRALPPEQLAAHLGALPHCS